MSIARAVLTGTIDSEVEKRFTPQNVAVTTFWLSLPGRPLTNGQPGAPSRVKVTCWRGMAEVAGSLAKDQVLTVEGKLSVPTYQTQDGVQKKYFEIDANTLSVLTQMPQVLQPAAGSMAPAEGAMSSNNKTTPSGNNYAQAPANTAALPQQAAAMAGSPASSGFDDDLYTVEDIPF